ncbi:MAG: hypothetical protein GXO10_07525, partial [Crenarchaeota archaeon]|nr:hypothetical protein [Thermoproteota archaeon]
MKTEKLTQEIIKELERTEPEKLHIKDRKGTKSTWTTKQTLKTILKTTKEIEHYIKQNKNIQTIKTLTATLTETLLYTTKLTYTKTLEIINKSLTKQLTLQDIALIKLLSYKRLEKCVSKSLDFPNNSSRGYIISYIKELVNDDNLKFYIKVIDIVKLVGNISRSIFDDVIKELDVYSKVRVLSNTFYSIISNLVENRLIKYYVSGIFIAEAAYKPLFSNIARVGSSRPEILSSIFLLCGNMIRSIREHGLTLTRSGVRSEIMISMILNYDFQDFIEKMLNSNISSEEAIFFLAGFIDGDGSIRKDGRIRIGISMNCRKGETVYNVIERCCKILGIKICRVRGNTDEISLKMVSPNIKHRIAEILSYFSFYEYKFNRLLELKKVNHYSKLSKNGEKSSQSNVI